jgi:hypothetical protein
MWRRRNALIAECASELSDLLATAPPAVALSQRAIASLIGYEGLSRLRLIRTLRRRKTLVVHLYNVALTRGSGPTFSPTSRPKHYGKRCVSTSAMAERALLYQEPGITALLALSSFLCLLNVINHLFDKWIYCGLLGQVFIGVAWDMPGAQWISKAIQGVFTQLGSLGLALLVYEGMTIAPPLHRLIR